MPEQHDRASEIFLALASVAPADRPERIAEACAGDEALRAEVESLLAELDASHGPLDTPPTPDLIDGPLELSMGTRVGEFTLLDILGTGGAGVVYRALQRRPVRAVALKLLRQGLASGNVRKRFEVEAEILGRMHHPGIAQVYAAHPGDATTPPYIALELVDGPPLTDYADQRQLSVAQRVELVALVCDAVQHAHQRGVIHRDLKPANILVTASGQPKVLDFGVARAPGGSVAHSTIETEEGQLMGTVPFMSPEQVEPSADQIDTRTDVYALGVILYRLLAGRLPFADDDPPLPELARRIAHDEPPRLSSVVPALEGDLDTIVARALAKVRDRRYASASDLASDLRRHLAGEPIAAVADSAWYVLRRRVSRYRTAFIASVAALVALATLSAWATMQQRRADRANVQLQRELASSTIERGRLLAQGGNHLLAEALVWPELFRAPGSRHALWTLGEIYSRQPALWARVGHEGGTNTVRFSRDGRLVLSAGNDGKVKLLDQATGREIRVFDGHRGRVIGAVFASDERRILSYGDDATVRLWDRDSGRQVLAESLGTHAIQSAMAVPDEDAFVICDDGGRVEHWRFGATLSRRLLAASGAACRVVAPHPSGAGVAAGFDRGLLRTWDLASGALVWERTVTDGSLTALAYSPDGAVLAAGGSDQVVRVLDPITGAERLARPSENGTVRRVSFDGTGRLLVVVGWWRTRVLDIASGLDRGGDIGVGEGAWDARITADGRWLVTCEEVLGRVRMWDLAASAIERTWKAHDARVSGITLRSAQAAGEITTSSFDGRIRSWRADGTPASERMFGRRVNALVASADGQWLVAGGDEGAIAWSPRTGASFPIPAGAVVTSLHVTESGVLVAGSLAGELSAWTLEPSGPRRLWNVSNLGGEVLGLASRERRLAVCYRDRTVALHDLDTGQALRRLDPSMTAFTVGFDRTGARLVVGTWGGTVYVFDVATGRRLHVLDGHSRLVGGLAIAPDDLVVSASRDGSTRLWDLDTGQPLATLARRDAGAERVRVLPGTPLRIAIGYDDGVVEIVDVEHFLRHVAGNVEYARRVHAADGAQYPRAQEVVEWSRRWTIDVPGRAGAAVQR